MSEKCTSQCVCEREKYLKVILRKGVASGVCVREKYLLVVLIEKAFSCVCELDKYLPLGVYVCKREKYPWVCK